MDTYFADKNGKVQWCNDPCTKKRNVRFPLCLAITYGDDVPFICADFLMNTSKKTVFIRTGSPLPEGSKVKLRFYIPPDRKLLGEFRGRVVAPPGNGIRSKGNYIRIRDFMHRKLDMLEQYLEEKRHLVDERV